MSKIEYQTLCSGYSLESSQQDNFNESPQHRVWKRTCGFRMPSFPRPSRFFCYCLPYNSLVLTIVRKKAFYAPASKDRGHIVLRLFGVKVICKGPGQISGSCFTKDGCFVWKQEKGQVTSIFSFLHNISTQFNPFPHNDAPGKQDF